MSLSSKLISGTKPEAETLSEIQLQLKLPPGKSLSFMVVETTFKDKKIYCCLAGGAFENGSAKLTMIGKAAFEALRNLPLGNQGEIIMQEVKLGPTPLRDKVRATVMRAEPGAKICFVGDMQGELDGHMNKALNLVPGFLNIAN